MSQIRTPTPGGGAGPFIMTLTGNNPVAVPPDAGHNINIIGAGAVNVTGNAGTNTLTITFTEIAPAYKAVVSPGYTVLVTDYFISCDSTTGAISIVLPMSPTLYQTFVIKDRTDDASINNISVSATGGALIDGDATYVMDGNDDSIAVLWNGVSWEIF